jgi:hypothetical protein
MAEKKEKISFPDSRDDTSEDGSNSNSSETTSETQGSESTTQQNGQSQPPVDSHGEHGAGPGYSLETDVKKSRGDIAEGGKNTAASRVGPDDSKIDSHEPQERLEEDVQSDVDAKTLREEHIDRIKEESSPVKEPDWLEEAQRVYEAPETDLELLQMVDAFIDEIDEDLQTAKERERAGEHYRVSDIFGNETTTQSQLGFEYVKNNGIIVDGDTYYGLQRIEPTKWTSEDRAGKKNIMGAYVAFLKSLQWGIAIPCYPRPFDFTRYLEQIHKAGTNAVSEGAHPVLDIGRRNHIAWADREIDPEKIKRKEFYVVCSVKTKTMKKEMAGRGEQTMIGLGLEWLSDVFSNQDDEDLEEACVNEIRQRQQTMKHELAKTGVEIEKVTERKEAMELLYYYYNHVEPVLDRFEHETMSKADFSDEVMP